MKKNPTSRYQNTQDKMSMQRALLFLVSGIGLLVFLLVLGVPLMTRLTGVFVDRKAPIANIDKIAPFPPIISTPLTATNSATISVKGNSESGSQVFLTKNKTVVSDTSVPETGEFSFGSVNLTQGINNFTAVAIDKAGNKSLESNTLSVSFASMLPNLTVETPMNAQVITGSNSRIEVKGKTDPGVRLRVNDRILVLSSTGGFSTFLNINEGETKITVTATDQAGNQTNEERRVTYAP